MATYTYKGTRITGTSTTAKVFPKSGIKSASSGNTYLNTETGHVYRCTTAGDASTAKWAYQRTDIIKRPTGAVASLAIARESGGSRVMAATWKVPPALTSSTSAARATELRATWALGIKGSDPTTRTIIGDESRTATTINLISFDAGNKTYTRSDFYPLTKRNLSYVLCRVAAANGKGQSSKCPSVTYNFERPRKPSIGAYSLDTETGEVSVTITTPPGADRHERYDTEYYWYVRNTTTGGYLRRVHTSDTSTSITLTVDASSYQSLGRGYIECTCKARARGYAGASEWVKRRYYLSYPKAATVTKLSAPTTNSTGKVVAYIKTNATKTHPVTQVQLQVLRDVDYTTVAQVEAAGDTWENVGGVDNGKCTALACAVSDVAPTLDGKRSWLHVKSWYAVEGVLIAYSKPVQLKTLYRPAYSAVGDTVTILDAYAGEDGKSAVVLMGWQSDGSTGTELSWSGEQDTWRSTDEPDSFEVTYDDGSVTHGGVTYAHSATITIKGLDEGATTYIKARRYAEGDNGTTYGPYSNTMMVTPAVIPASVVLDVPAYVADGEGITCEWTYDSDAAQTAWQLIDSAGTIVAQAENALGSHTIDAARAAGLATDNALSLAVRVSMGGTTVTSDYHNVTIVEPPTLTASTAATLTAQPMSISATCDAADAELTIIVTANGTSGDTPSGVRVQAAGDVVWSGVVEPEWSNGAATVTLPEGRAFYDKASYTATVVATDPSTGLSSATVTASTTVAWAHQAPDPAGFATVEDNDYTDEDGTRHRTATITLTPPTGSVSTDCYDIYRLTGDGAQLIGQTYPLTVTTVDEYAPFGDDMTQAYRIACRTADGDVAWADVDYYMGGSVLRIDWAGNYVELPYNLAINDGYAKDVDVHEYLDGSTDAFWNQGIRRTASLATDVMRLEDADTIAGVLALAHHVGPAFVRTPTGAAYEADVQVDSVTPSSELAAVSISATEIRLTAAYMLPPYNVDDETE